MSRTDTRKVFLAASADQIVASPRLNESANLSGDRSKPSCTDALSDARTTWNASFSWPPLLDGSFFCRIMNVRLLRDRSATSGGLSSLFVLQMRKGADGTSSLISSMLPKPLCSCC